jgi:glycosyltransferase involved in cell wall biosynthesis
MAQPVETSLAVPLVSVVTATYNWSSVLRHAISSVRRQSLTDLEMIIVGDACTDDTAEVVASLNDGRLRWHNRGDNSGNQGLPNNDGLAMARGRYVAYLGQDDLWYPTHLATMVATIEQTGADLAYALTLLLGVRGYPYRVLRGFEPPGGHHRDVFLPPSSIMHRRELGLEVGWRDYHDMVRPPDADFVSRLWDASGRFAPTRELSVFKFPSTSRPNSYILKPSHEQAAYLERMAAEPDFIERELLATLEDAAVPLLIEEGKTPGGLVTHYRQMRGLEPAPVPDLDLRILVWRSFRRRFRPAKAAVRRLAAWIEAI